MISCMTAVDTDDDDVGGGFCIDCGAPPGKPHEADCEEQAEARRILEEREDEIAADFIDGWWPR